MSRALEGYKDIYDRYLKQQRNAIVDGYWHTREYRLKFDGKKEDFIHIQNTTESVLEGLEILITTLEGEREKPGVQPYINEIASTIDLHLNKISKYFDKNSPKGFKTKESKREEHKFQRLVFKGQEKIKTKLRTLNIKNNMDHLTIKFWDNVVATLPMKNLLYERDSKIAAKIDSLEIDWDLVMDNGMFINMNKRDIPDYNEEKHFWDQEIETLQFYVSEWNKINKGVVIDNYEMSPWLYFHLNYFKTPIKNLGNKITNPPLRDNEWYIDEIKKHAKKRAELLESAAIMIFGSRRFSKTTGESSHTHHGMLLYTTQTGTITSTTEKDLNSLVDKIKKSLDNIHPAFKLNILSGKSWNSEVLFGIKSGSGRISYEHFTLSIINTDGSSKKGSQKTAGGNPIIYVADEIGKDTFLKAHRAAVPSFESDDGWVCQPIYSGTSGEEDLTKDAETVLRDPVGNNFLEMDWDILEYGIPKQYISWKRRPFGWFLPAQMSTRTGNQKIETNLADFLKIESEELSKVKMFVTDWEGNLKSILETRKKLSGDDLQQEIVFRPIDPEECFMSAKNNPFPAQEAKLHKEKLISEGNEETGIGKPVELYRDQSDFGTIKYRLSSKKIAKYPHKGGGYIDSPIILFEELPTEQPPMFMYFMGLDDYKHEQSDGDSIGSIHIYKRDLQLDKHSGKIVATLATRPDPHGKFHDQIHMLLDAFNAICFPENEDMDIKKYFDKMGLSDRYLGTSFDVSAKLNFTNTGNRKYGWQPTKVTTPFVLGLVIDYCKKEFEIKDDSGNIIGIKRGVEQIDDIYLLDEIINYKEGGNFDRIISFGSALFYDHYCNITYKFPKIYTKKEKELSEKSEKSLTKHRFFTNSGRSKY